MMAAGRANYSLLNDPRHHGPPTPHTGGRELVSSIAGSPQATNNSLTNPPSGSQMNHTIDANKARHSVDAGGRRGGVRIGGAAGSTYRGRVGSRVGDTAARDVSGAHQVESADGESVGCVADVADADRGDEVPGVAWVTRRVDTTALAARVGCGRRKLCDGHGLADLPEAVRAARTDLTHAGRRSVERRSPSSGVTSPRLWD